MSNIDKSKFIGIFEMSFHKDTRIAQKLFADSQNNIDPYAYNANIYYLPRISNFHFYKKYFKIIFYFPKLLSLLKICIIFLKCINFIKNKKDLINLKIENIVIGDLIYDTIIRKHFVPTVKIKNISTKFEIFLAISKLIFWKDFFKSNQGKIKYMCASHSNYSIAIPLRVSLNNNIPTYIVNIETIYKLKKNKKFVGLHYPNLHIKAFSKIKNKKKFINFSKKKIYKRFEMGKGFDLPPTFKNIFYKSNKLKINISKEKINCLIALHDFFDAPNAKGTFIFNDFYEWISWLSNYSHSRSDINWYIKPHPSILEKEKQLKICKNINLKFNNGFLLDSNTSHKDLINKVDFALTCRGTIGYEYPFFGKPVIMASNKHNFIDYNFCSSSNSITNYEKKLNNIKKIIKNFKINKKEIYKFYFTQYFLFNSSSWVIDEYERSYNHNFKRQDPKSSRLSSKVIEKYYKKINDNKFVEPKIKIIKKFIKSNKFKLIYNDFI